MSWLELRSVEVWWGRKVMVGHREENVVEHDT